MGCSCQTKPLTEDDSDSSFEEKKLTDPTILAYKKALKDLTPTIQSAKNSSDGKQLGEEYWTNVSKLIKKAKLGIAMFELGLDGDGDIEPENSEKPDITPMGDTRDGDEQFDKEEEETEKEKEEAEKEEEEAEKEEAEKEEEEAEKEEEKTESVSEDAKSASQQRLFGMVYALKKGELKKDSVTKTLWEKVKKISDGISLDDAKDFAETKHTDLPKRLPATESKESLLDSARHLGIILESVGSKIKSIIYFNGGLVVEVKTNDTIHCVCIGEGVSLEGVDYSVYLGDKTDFGSVANNFNKISEFSESQLQNLND